MMVTSAPARVEEERRREAGRAAADDGDALVGAAGGLGGLELGEDLVKATAGGLELAGADLGALCLVEGALALGTAGVRAEVAGDVGQGVSAHDDAQGLGDVALVDGVQVGRDVLLDGAAGAARGREAARERQRGAHLVGLGRLDGLVVQRAFRGLLAQGGDGGHVDVLATLHALKDVRDLAEALVAAGLEHRGGHGDGPDARGVQVMDVAGVGAAGVADAQLAVELG